jgi:hypothetical protein
MTPGDRTISSTSHGHELHTKSGTKSWLTLPWPNALCVQIDYGEMVEQGGGGKEAMRLVDSMRRNGYAVVRLPETDADLMKSTWEAARGFGWKPLAEPRFPSSDFFLALSLLPVRTHLLISIVLMRLVRAPGQRSTTGNMLCGGGVIVIVCPSLTWFSAPQ